MILVLFLMLALPNIYTTYNSKRQEPWFCATHPISDVDIGSSLKQGIHGIRMIVCWSQAKRSVSFLKFIMYEIQWNYYLYHTTLCLIKSDSIFKINWISNVSSKWHKIQLEKGRDQRQALMPTENKSQANHQHNFTLTCFAHTTIAD